VLDDYFHDLGAETVNKGEGRCKIETPPHLFPDA
jgi:hypothetical protein